MAQEELLPLEQMLPSRLLLIPMSGRPFFPGVFTPLMISSEEDGRTVEAAYQEDGFIGIVMLKNEPANSETPEVKDLYKVGTVAKIIKKLNLPDGGVNIFISTLKRFKIRKVLSRKQPMAAAAEYVEEEDDRSVEVKALTRALLSDMKEISENSPLFTEEMRLNMVNIDHPGRIADFITSILNIEKNEQQHVLETFNVKDRLEEVLVFIKREQELFRIQKKIQVEINDRVAKNQREYFLREELKTIKDELGMITDAKTSEYQKFKEKLAAFQFSGEVLETVENELEKFQLMDPNSSEFIVTRNYLETISALPWGKESPEDYKLESAKQILERAHYGLDDVKKRVLEYLAVRKLKKDSKGSILLLVGPPGVGKTSVGKSIAEAMNKPFFRFSVGGMRDEAEIRGHRRTYVGAIPGRIIQGLKICKRRSSVFLIDEIDKMGQSMQGDPASALLEVLDPEQNNTFRDHYLDLPFDLSEIFFILTANTLDNVPEPLVDRAEIIHLSGYIDQEKIEIARKYLVPKSLKKHGLGKNQVHYSMASLYFIAQSYARESGVRRYEQSLDKIHRKLVAELMELPEVAEALRAVEEVTKKELAASKAARKEEREAEKRKKLEEANAAPQKKRGRPSKADIATAEALEKETGGEKTASGKGDGGKGEDSVPAPAPPPPSAEMQEALDAYSAAVGKSYDIGVREIEKYLEKPLFDESEMIKADRPGTAVGLAWTSMGGDTLLVEAAVVPGKEGFTLTGQLGDVMKESAAIALSWTRKYAIEQDIVEVSWFKRNTIHLHIPEGATPKDGPSAGITMTTAILSLLKKKTIKPDWAMTGELSLTGQVLPIGGLKEKTVAAKRNRVKHIIIPRKNLRDWEKIPEHVRKGVEHHPVSSMEEVLSLVF